MSVRWITWAWEQETTSSGERLVLLALADHAGEDGECFPSSGRIAAKTRVGRSTVRLHIERLVARGLLVKVRRRRHEDGTLGTWEYRLVSSADGSAVVKTTSADGPALVGRRAEPSGSTVSTPKPPRRERRPAARREWRPYDDQPLGAEEIMSKYGVEA